MFILLSLTAHAMTGSYSADADARTDAMKSSVDEVLDDAGLVLRMFARKSLYTNGYSCDQYELDVGADRVVIHCDGELFLDQPTAGGEPWTTPTGHLAHDTDIDVQDGALEVLAHFEGDGTRRMTWKRVGDSLEFQTEMYAPALPRPVVWSLDYDAE